MSWLKKLFGTGGEVRGERGPAADSLVGERVLVADPSLTIQKVVELTLGEEGCDVRVLRTSEEARSALVTYRPTVVIASAALAAENSGALYDAARSRADAEGMIILVAKGFAEHLDEALQSRIAADELISKPFEPADLIARVRAKRKMRPIETR